MEKIFCALFLFGLFGSPEAALSRPKMVIDHDGGADDAYAITIAFQYEKYFYGPNIVALTTTFGNVNLTQANINTGKFLRLNDRTDVPVYSGACRSLIEVIPSDNFFGFDGLGDNMDDDNETVTLEKEHSAIALIELSKKYEGELIVVALGPLTNLALAIRLDPHFMSRLAHLYVGGGHLYSIEYPNPEFNAAMDVEAYYIVADAAEVGKVTFVPFSQVYKSLTITKEWRIDVLGSIDSPIIKQLTRYERISLQSSPTWTLLDPAVAAIALDNRIVTEFKESNNSIITCGENRGVNINYVINSISNSHIVFTADLRKYKDFLLTVLSAGTMTTIENGETL